MGDDERPVPWDVPVNVELMNRQFMERSVEAWAGVERDRWLYCFDTEDSILPDFEKPAPGMKRRVDEEQLFRDLGEESTRQGKDRKKVKDTAMSKEAARRLSGGEEEDWETRPEPEQEQEQEEDVGGDAEARSREEKEAKEMEEGYRDFEGE